MWCIALFDVLWLTNCEVVSWVLDPVLHMWFTIFDEPKVLVRIVRMWADNCDGFIFSAFCVTMSGGGVFHHTGSSKWHHHNSLDSQHCGTFVDSTCVLAKGKIKDFPHPKGFCFFCCSHFCGFMLPLLISGPKNVNVWQEVFQAPVITNNCGDIPRPQILIFSQELFSANIINPLQLGRSGQHNDIHIDSLKFVLQFFVVVIRDLTGIVIWDLTASCTPSHWGWHSQPWSWTPSVPCSIGSSNSMEFDTTLFWFTDWAIQQQCLRLDWATQKHIFVHRSQNTPVWCHVSNSDRD